MTDQYYPIACMDLIVVPVVTISIVNLSVIAERILAVVVVYTFYQDLR